LLGEFGSYLARGARSRFLGISGEMSGTTQLGAIDRRAHIAKARTRRCLRHNILTSNSALALSTSMEDAEYNIVFANHRSCGPDEVRRGWRALQVKALASAT
jgi:hypothetical protein